MKTVAIIKYIFIVFLIEFIKFLLKEETNQ